MVIQTEAGVEEDLQLRSIDAGTLQPAGDPGVEVSDATIRTSRWLTPPPASLLIGAAWGLMKNSWSR